MPPTWDEMFSGQEDRVKRPSEDFSRRDVSLVEARAPIATASDPARPRSFDDFFLEPAVPEPAVPEPAAPEPAAPEPAVPEPAVPEPAVPEPAVPEPAVPRPAASAQETFDTVDRHLASVLVKKAEELFGGLPGIPPIPLPGQAINPLDLVTGGETLDTIRSLEARRSRMAIEVRARKALDNMGFWADLKL